MTQDGGRREYVGPDSKPLPPDGAVVDAAAPIEPPAPHQEPLAAMNKALLMHGYQEAPVAMIMLDPEGHILNVNRALCSMSGYPADNLVGEPLTVLLGSEHQADVARILQKMKTGTQTHQVDRRLIRRDGESIWVRNSAAGMQQDGRLAGLFVVVEDIDQGRKATERLEFLTSHDEITGLFNRRHLEIHLGRAVETASTHRAQAALLCLDLDGFKLVNDTLGHGTGDQLLRDVGKGLAECLAEGDLLARLGGDEFGIVRPGGSATDATELADKILRTFDQPFALGGYDLRIGASIGITTWPEDGSTVGELMQNADSAMYLAKRQGRNRYATFTSDLRKRAMDRMQIESRLRKALAAGEFHAEFQPILESKDKKLTRFEAVCRWRNEELGNVPPMQFIPVAEEMGLMVPLGQFMLREACLAAVAWTNKGLPAGVAVNISGMEFAQEDFVESVMRTVRETGVKPTLLELEVNECVFDGDIESCIDKIGRLKSMGVSVTLDDFGTGQSSLSYLRRIPVTALKIDRTSVADLQGGPSAVALLRSIVGIAKSFRLRVLADGVETEHQLRLLRFLGCDEVQGFLFGKPEPLETATALLVAERASIRASRATESLAAIRSASSVQARRM